MTEIIIKFSETSSPKRITKILDLVRRMTLLKIEEDYQKSTLERLKQQLSDNHLACQEQHTQTLNKCSKLEFDFRLNNENFHGEHLRQTERGGFEKWHKPVLLVMGSYAHDEDPQ